jgi:hypothetical protein
MDEEIALRHLIDSRFRSALRGFGGAFPCNRIFFRPQSGRDLLLA